LQNGTNGVNVSEAMASKADNESNKKSVNGLIDMTNDAQVTSDAVKRIGSENILYDRSKSDNESLSSPEPESDFLTALVDTLADNGDNLIEYAATIQSDEDERERQRIRRQSQNHNTDSTESINSISNNSKDVNNITLSPPQSTTSESKKSGFDDNDHSVHSNASSQSSNSTGSGNTLKLPTAHPVRQPSGVAGQYILNKITVDTNVVLGTGSMGTVVYGGQFEGRQCAIKRLVKPFYGETYADKEIALLIATDQHPNMLRYYAKEEDSDFIYIALERCNGTLLDMVSVRDSPITIIHSQQGNNADIQLLKEAHKYKLQILRDMCTGLAHLHAMNIVHRDLKPVSIRCNLCTSMDVNCLQNTKPTA
jgi:hypothetical protein